MPKKHILVTGATGFIGSHVVAALCETNRYRVTMLDNGSNSDVDVVQAALNTLCNKDAEKNALCSKDAEMNTLCNKDAEKNALCNKDNNVEKSALCNKNVEKNALCNKSDEDKVQRNNAESEKNNESDRKEKPLNPVCVRLDLRVWNREKHDALLRGVDAVIHCAGWKSVGESVEMPLTYYDNNVVGTLRLLEAMRRQSVNAIVFSSSATVYGTPQTLPIDESQPVRPVNPYGQSKAMVEQIIRDVVASSSSSSTSASFSAPSSSTSGNSAFAAILLRYFNPCGCHESAAIGENPRGIPNNLQPYIAQVADGSRPFLRIFGADWPTPDGTAIRDYIHVVDLANAHVAAIDYVMNCRANGDAKQGVCETINLGTGRGYSVMEMVRAFENACGKQIPFQIVERRAGDVAACYANASKAEKLLGWKATRTLQQMCNDAWRYIRQEKQKQ